MSGDWYWSMVDFNGIQLLTGYNIHILLIKIDNISYSGSTNGVRGFTTGCIKKAEGCMECNPRLIPVHP